MQSIKQQIDTQLVALMQASNALHELTVDLSLLDAVTEVTAKVTAALELLQKQGNGLNANDFVNLLVNHESIDILDEIVDSDAISELENRFFAVIENMEDGLMGAFLTELIDKIEQRYARLVDAVHRLNALLSLDGEL